MKTDLRCFNAQCHTAMKIFSILKKINCVLEYTEYHKCVKFLIVTYFNTWPV